MVRPLLTTSDALRRSYIADDLEWPLTIQNDHSFYILRCLSYLRSREL